MSDHDAAAHPPALSPPSAAARERAVELLTRSYAADNLSDAELQARLDRVYQATSVAELQSLVADLPATAEGVEPGQRVVATFSGQEQRLTGALPRRLELRARFGYVELDLTRASVQPGITEIDVRSFAGYVEIRLPPGVRVECTGHAFLGYFSLKGGSDTELQGQPLIRIRGRAALGYAECYRSAGQASLPAASPPPLQPGEG